MGVLRGWRTRGVCAAVATLFGFAPFAVAQAETPAVAPLPIEAYGQEAHIDMMALSPSGDRLARVEVLSGQRILIVSQLTSGERLYAARVGEIKVRGLSWAGEDHVMIFSSGTHSIADLGVPKTELNFGNILDLKTQKLVQVLQRTPDIVAMPYDGISVRHTTQGPMIFARGFNALTGETDLHSIDLTTGRGRSVQPMKREVIDYVLDQEGEVIALADYTDRTGRWALRLPVSWRFSDDWTTTELIDRPILVGQGRTPRTVMVYAARPELSDETDSETGRSYFEVNVDTREWRPMSSETKVGGLLFHPRTGLSIGTYRSEDFGGHYSFEDPTASQRWRSILAAFPDQSPQLVTWNHALNRVLIFSDRDGSGLYHLVDFKTGRADVVGEAYPAITADHVGKVSALSYLAADGLEIPAFVTLPPGVTEAKNLPLVVMPHGGPAVRDNGAYDYWAQAIASRGYVVLQPNFRGSSGYGRAFMEAGFGEWGRKMQTDLSDGVRHLAAEGMIDPERVCIVGASYGGYAALAGVTLDAEVYRCAISINGVSDLRRMVNREARDTGTRSHPTVRYWNRFMGAEDRGRNLDAWSPALLTDRVKVPVLLIHGRDDTVVPIEQSRVMATALTRAGKPHEFIELEGEDHWMSRVDSRQRMLKEVGRFLETHNPVQ